jgi:hypothetical protein
MAITLKDRLSHLTYREASKLLGPEGERLIRQGGKYPIDIDEQVTWERDLFRLNLGDAIVTFSLDHEDRKSLHFACSKCTSPCEHLAAAFSLILEEKLALGLSAPPPERRPVESLSDEELIRQAVEERKERAQKEKMTIKSANGVQLWTDYTVTSHASGKSYRVALRGWERGDSYCSCPDFRKNTLGTCKHIMVVTEEVKKRFSKTVREKPYQIKNISVHLRYGEETELRLLVPEKLDHRATTFIRPLMNKPIGDVKELLQRIKEVERLGHEVTLYPDAEEYIHRALYLDRIRNRVSAIRKDPKTILCGKRFSRGSFFPTSLTALPLPLEPEGPSLQTTWDSAKRFRG